MVAGLVHPHQGSGTLPREQTVQKLFDEQRVQGVDLASKFLGPLSNRASVGCDGRPHLTTHTLKDLLLRCWCQIPQHTFRGPEESMPRHVRAAIATQGGSKHCQAGGFNVKAELCKLSNWVEIWLL